MDISIIIPFYNRCKIITDTLLSICFQSFFLDNSIIFEIVNLNEYNDKNYKNNKIIKSIKSNKIIKNIKSNNIIKIIKNINTIKNNSDINKDLKSYETKYKINYRFSKTSNLFNNNIFNFDYEVIIVDDGSNCNVEDYFKRYFNQREEFLLDRIKYLNDFYKSLKIDIKKVKKIDIKSHVLNFLDHIKIVKLDKNNGVAYARNMGIKKSKGNYIFFLDSDDLWNFNKLKIHIFFQLFLGKKIFKTLKDIQFLQKKINKNFIFIFDNKIKIKACFLFKENINGKFKSIFKLFQKRNNFVAILNDEEWYRNGKFINKPDKFIFDENLSYKIFDRTVFAISSLSLNRSIIKYIKKKYKNVFINELIVEEDFDFFIKLIFFVNPLIIFNNLNIKISGNSDQLTKIYKNKLLSYKTKVFERLIKSNNFHNLDPKYKKIIIKSYEKYKKTLNKYIKI